MGIERNGSFENHEVAEVQQRTSDAMVERELTENDIDLNRVDNEGQNEMSDSDEANWCDSIDLDSISDSDDSYDTAEVPDVYELDFDTVNDDSEPKRFEDYSSEEMSDMAKYDPEKAQALNEDYQERVSAEKLGMSQEEYRAHLRRIADANKDDGEADALPDAQTVAEELQMQQEDIFSCADVGRNDSLSNNATDALSSTEVSKQYFNETGRFEDWNAYSSRCLEIGRDESPSKNEKVAEIQNTYYATYDKTDICPPSDAQYVKDFDETGKIEYGWPDNLGFEAGTESSVSRDNPPELTWDRYGHMGGSNFSPIPESGPYTTDERSIPYIPNQDAYHHGDFNVDTYFDKIDAIRNNDYEGLNDILASEGYEVLEKFEYDDITFDYFENCERLKDSVNGNIDTTYGLKGNVASWGNMNGGAEQLTSPLNGLQMERLGVIREESDYE